MVQMIQMMQQMQQMQRGLNIVKGSDGKTIKVLKK